MRHPVGAQCPPEKPSTLSGLGSGLSVHIPGAQPYPGAYGFNQQSRWFSFYSYGPWDASGRRRRSGQGHRAAQLPLVNLGAQGGHTVVTSWKMVPTAGKPATWELPSPHPAYQFRFLLQEGENPTQGGLRECTIHRKERSRGRAGSRHSSIQRLQQHPRA